MPQSPESEKAKQDTSKVRPKKTAQSKAQDSPRPKSTKPPTHATVHSEPTAPSRGPVLTHEEYRSRIAQKAFELYEKRRALTELDDWVEAERLVKLQLLDEQRGASV